MTDLSGRSGAAFGTALSPESLSSSSSSLASSSVYSEGLSSSASSSFTGPLDEGDFEGRLASGAVPTKAPAPGGASRTLPPAGSGVLARAFPAWASPSLLRARTCLTLEVRMSVAKDRVPWFPSRPLAHQPTPRVRSTQGTTNRLGAECPVRTCCSGQSSKTFEPDCYPPQAECMSLMQSPKKSMRLSWGKPNFQCLVKNIP